MHDGDQDERKSRRELIEEIRICRRTLDLVPTHLFVIDEAGVTRFSNGSVSETMASESVHAINNALAGIKNAFALIKRGIDDEFRWAHYVPIIESEIDRIGAIVGAMSRPSEPDVEEDRIPQCAKTQ